MSDQNFRVKNGLEVGIGGTILITNSIGNIGIGTTNPTSKLTVGGDALVSGIVTASSFVGTLVGVAASATQLVNPVTFEITGDIVASPISFDGTGNVSLAATIQPDSVELGTDTFGDYVQSISGTANQITVTAGTGEGSTPTISIPSNPTLPGNVTIANNLQVNNNLNVTGNITIGGTSAYIISNDFRVKDADIVLGFTTDSYGNDVSNDTTANHGGIAIASTEGTPLVQLYNPGIGETNPATYKKIMWFKSGAFAGLNTDAWLSNYAIGIGSTQVPAGTRLAAGAVQFTEQDLSVVRNINASGIVTAGTLNVGVGGTIITTTGIGSVGIGSTLPGSTLVVNAPSSYTGNLLDLRSGSASRVKLSAAGTMQLGPYPPHATYLTIGQDSTSRDFLISTNSGGGPGPYLTLWSNVGIKFWTANYELGVFASYSNWAWRNTHTIGWASGDPSSTSMDVVLCRDAANTFAQRNSTNAQSFRIYNTYTSASQYERAYLGWNNNTFEIGVGTAGVSTARSISLVGAAGSNTGDTLQPLQINQTWTAGTGIATALTLNVTDTSSSSSSRLLDLRVGGSSKFSIDKSGNLSLSSGTGGNLTFSFYQLFLGSSTGGININNNTNSYSALIPGDKAYGWTNTNNNYSGLAAGLFSDGSNTVAQRNGVGAAQTFRIYNTWTNSTNSFERANLGWTNNDFIVGTEKGSSIGTARNLYLQTDGTTRVAITTDGKVGIGTTVATESLTVFGKAQVLQDSGSNNRLILRGQPSSAYRWNIDNYSASNNFRIFREDDTTAANGYVGLSIDPSGGTVISGVTTVGLANTSTPPSNSQMSFELISNTQLRIKVRGTDGVLRSADITLS